MKYLLVVVVVAVLLWWLFGRGGRIAKVQRQAARRDADAPVAMLACAHCGVHLPKSDAVFDAAGQPYCGEPHRLAGPRR